MTQDIAAIAKGLSEAQRRYILACGASEGPYEPRHGVTCNWALRRGFADSLWYREEDGKAVFWDHLTREGLKATKMLGCALTESGQAVRAYLIEREG